MSLSCFLPGTQTNAWSDVPSTCNTWSSFFDGQGPASSVCTTCLPPTRIAKCLKKTCFMRDYLSGGFLYLHIWIVLAVNVNTISLYWRHKVFFSPDLLATLPPTDGNLYIAHQHSREIKTTCSRVIIMFQFYNLHRPLNPHWSWVVNEKSAPPNNISWICCRKEKRERPPFYGHRTHQFSKPGSNAT